MRRILSGILTALGTALVAAVAASALVPSAPNPVFQAAPGGYLPAGTPAPMADPRATPGPLAAELARLRLATDRYRDPGTAVRAGYQPSPTCVQLPGRGGLGYQYTRAAGDGLVDPLRPEVLVFIPAPGGRRLGGVGYLRTDRDQDLATDDDRPALFGRAFDGPTPGSGPASPVRYHLHVWSHYQNPTGVFAPFNPRVSCTVRH